MDGTERLKRVHVASVRAVKDKFVVVLSDPEIKADGTPILNPDTWEVSWDQWVKSGARAETLV